MMNGILPKHCGKFAVGFGITGALVYLLMINVTLAHLESVSGHVPFDMRPFGYGPAGAATLLDALGADGRGYYLRYQIPLDTVYPALLAMTLIATICWLANGMPNGGLVRAGVTLAVGSALFDYIENLGIVAMIWSWPEVYVPLVYAAGAATIAKSAVTTLAVLLVICLGFVRGRMSRADFRL